MSEYYLVHHGIKGQKWGVRRFQNEDGTLTSAGKKRYETVQKAADKASEFSKEAYKNADLYKNGVPSRVNGTTVSDLKRWEDAERIQAKVYKEIADKLKNTKISELDNKSFKKVKEFLKNGSFVDAPYADYYYNGKWNNYLQSMKIDF